MTHRGPEPWFNNRTLGKAHVPLVVSRGDSVETTTLFSVVGCVHPAVLRLHNNTRPGGIARAGERTFCFVDLFDGEEQLIAARPRMITFLDTVREMLEEN
jgi:hypothetical protein